MLAFALLLSSDAGAAQAPPPAAPDDIVVTATKQSALRDLRSVMGLVDGYVTRFDESFCPKVMGLDAELTRVIEARLRANAAALGLLAKPDCKPTAVAIFIERPRELMRALRDRRPDLFRLHGNNETITSMIRRDQLFYAWRAVVRRSADGSSTGPVVFTNIASRIVTPARYDIVASYVVMDIARIEGMTTTQLADFATMQLLNNTNGRATGGTARSSILSLFEGDDPAAAPAQLSAFDRGLLAGLYDKRLVNLYAGAQRGRIAGRIAEEENEER